MNKTDSQCVVTQMLIRNPVSQVFEAFIDPAITKNFWFTKGSGKLEVGKTIIWEWEMYNVSTKDSTGGFTTVLDGLKAFLEYNINLNLIADKYPKEVIQHGQ